LLSGRVLGILVVVLAASCSGDPALSKEEYVTKLNASCEDFIEAENEKGPRILDAFETTILAKARSLKAPDEIADQAKRLAELAEQQRDVLGKLIDAARDNDVAKVRQLVSRNQVVNKEAGSIARDFGANACAGE
jgi:FixJ family two-component response regulator